MIDFSPFEERIAAELQAYRDRGLRMFATSSFQTNSVVLLHLLSRLAPEVPVYFMNTGYHFPETLAFKRDLAKRTGLSVTDLFSPFCRAQQRDASGRLLFTSDPDHCCHVNKVLPLDPVLAANDVWISGIRGTQSAHRSGMGREQRGRAGTLRYHPLLDWNAKMVHYYIEASGMPRHPLEDSGYFSVGCQPCTRKTSVEDFLDGRGGRWFGMKKTECGLHTEVEER